MRVTKSKRADWDNGINYIASRTEVADHRIDQNRVTHALRCDCKRFIFRPEAPPPGSVAAQTRWCWHLTAHLASVTQPTVAEAEATYFAPVVVTVQTAVGAQEFVAKRRAFMFGKVRAS